MTTITLDTPITTDDLKNTAEVAWQQGETVRLCDASRCVLVIPDLVYLELEANGARLAPTWLHVWSSVRYPGRTAHVYANPQGIAA